MTIVPERIIEARQELMYTQTELADKTGISRMSISKIEKGLLLMPSAQMVSSLSRVLHKPQNFFFIDEQNSLVDTTYPTFRSYKVRTKASNKVSSIKLKRGKSFVAYLYKFIKPRYIDFKDLFPENAILLQDADIEAIAMNLRKRWKLGDGRISNLITLMENHGIICQSVDLPEKVDSINVSFHIFQSEDETSLVLYNEKLTYYRQRFSVAHELGHIILHHYIEDVLYEEHADLLEKQANRFASAFLMPCQSFIGSIYNATSIKGIKSLKEIWGVSMAAIIHRLKDLKVLTINQQEYLNIEISRHGWRKIEPMDLDTPVEVPYYLNNAYQFVFKNNLVTPEEVSKHFGLYSDEIVRYIGNNALFITTMPINIFSAYSFRTEDKKELY